jgi:hypothetical protein
MDNVPDKDSIKKLENRLVYLIVEIRRLYSIKERGKLTHIEEKILNGHKSEYYDISTELNDLNPSELILFPSDCAEISKRTGKLIPVITQQLKAIRISQRILDEVMRQTRKTKIDVILDLIKI